MIERVEKAMIGWGDEYRMRGMPGYKCPLGNAIANKGVLIMATDGSQGSVLYTGDLGEVGEAVELALVGLRQPVEAGGMGATGDLLVRLARVRYLTDPMPSLARQMRRMGLSTKVAYFDRLHALHVAVEPILLEKLPWLRKAA